MTCGASTQWHVAATWSDRHLCATAAGLHSIRRRSISAPRPGRTRRITCSMLGALPCVGRREGTCDRSTAGSFNTGEQFCLLRPAAAAVVPHALDVVPDQHLALRPVGLVDHPLLAAAVAHDTQEPRRERAHGLVQGLLAGRQRMIAIAAPVALRDRPGRHQCGRIRRAKNALISDEAS
jgi:hypothetical protein